MSTAQTCIIINDTWSPTGVRFWTGTRWSAEYPDAMRYTERQATVDFGLLAAHNDMHTWTGEIAVVDGYGIEDRIVLSIRLEHTSRRQSTTAASEPNLHATTGAHTAGPWAINGEGLVIATVHGFDITAPTSSRFEQPPARVRLANARLVAAAPELLDLIRRIIRSADETWRTEARALLARVDG
jgi:hypothetical protein